MSGEVLLVAPGSFPGLSILTHIIPTIFQNTFLGSPLVHLQWLIVMNIVPPPFLLLMQNSNSHLLSFSCIMMYLSLVLFRVYLMGLTLCILKFLGHCLLLVPKCHMSSVLSSRTLDLYQTHVGCMSDTKIACVQHKKNQKNSKNTCRYVPTNKCVCSIF